MGVGVVHWFGVALELGVEIGVGVLGVFVGVAGGDSSRQRGS